MPISCRLRATIRRMDDIDRKILALLVEDGRRTYDDIGRRVSLSAPGRQAPRRPPARAAARCRASRRWSTTPRWARTTEALVELFYAPGTLLDEVARVAARHPEVVEAWSVTGEADAIARVRTQRQRRPRAADHGAPARRPRRAHALADRHVAARRRARGSGLVDPAIGRSCRSAVNRARVIRHSAFGVRCRAGNSREGKQHMHRITLAAAVLALSTLLVPTAAEAKPPGRYIVVLKQGAKLTPAPGCRAGAPPGRQRQVRLPPRAARLRGDAARGAARQAARPATRSPTSSADPACASTRRRAAPPWGIDRVDQRNLPAQLDLHVQRAPAPGSMRTSSTRASASAIRTSAAARLPASTSSTAARSRTASATGRTSPAPSAARPTAWPRASRLIAVRIGACEQSLAPSTAIAGHRLGHRRPPAGPPGRREHELRRRRQRHHGHRRPQHGRRRGCRGDRRGQRQRARVRARTPATSPRAACARR